MSDTVASTAFDALGTTAAVFVTTTEALDEARRKLVALLRNRTAITVTLVPAPGWHEVSVDRGASTVTLPAGVELDLGATGKAFAADRAATAVQQAVGGGVLINLGGDVATAGPPPDG